MQKVKLPALPRGASVARPSVTAPKPTRLRSYELRRGYPRLSIVRSKLLWGMGALRYTLRFPVAIPVEQ